MFSSEAEKTFSSKLISHKSCIDISYINSSVFPNSRSANPLEWIAQRGGRCPIPGNIQGQVGWGSEKPDLIEDVPARCRGVGLDDL